MFGMGMGELIVILIVALLFLGPQKLPEAAKAIGKGIRELRRHTQDLQQTLEQDEELGETVRELRSALRGEEAPRPRVAPPRPSPPIASAPTPPTTTTSSSAPDAASSVPEGETSGNHGQDT